jgi:hypothetical protein
MSETTSPVMIRIRSKNAVIRSWLAWSPVQARKFLATEARLSSMPPEAPKAALKTLHDPEREVHQDPDQGPGWRRTLRSTKALQLSARLGRQDRLESPLAQLAHPVSQEQDHRAEVVEQDGEGLTESDQPGVGEPDGVVVDRQDPLEPFQHRTLAEGVGEPDGEIPDVRAELLQHRRQPGDDRLRRSGSRR